MAAWVCPARSATPSDARAAPARCPRARINHERQRRPQACLRTAFGQRPRAAQHQQTAAAAVDEVRDHLQLIAREETGLDAADDEAAILEQLFAGLREAADDLVFLARKRILCCPRSAAATRSAGSCHR